ncbi:helix-hairpin-helix domain-containing protein [Peptoniphilus raoultii]|uniref:helix-hairpin-helix domain-containing protein n=1 Tax=Peptoniphilus raoultii TaxID=1776387 RepID=UPI0008DA2016|nr:helix-hairpin-helix domain-containing protein [Peptoniphilus raoultii]
MDYINKNSKYLVVLLLIILGGYLAYNSKNSEKYIDPDFYAENQETGLSNEMTFENSSQVDEDKEIYVHIAGEVKNPGLVKLKSGDRLVDAIEKTGGATDEADLDKVNLARKLSDEDKIYIPKIGENPSADAGESESQMMGIISKAEGSVDLNNASKEELMTLPGVGEKTSQKILDYREKFTFKSPEDLKNIEGIGDKKYEKLKNYICVR